MRYEYYQALPVESRYVFICDQTQRYDGVLSSPHRILFGTKLVTSGSSVLSQAYECLRKVEYYAL